MPFGLPEKGETKVAVFRSFKIGRQKPNVNLTVSQPLECGRKIDSGVRAKHRLLSRVSRSFVRSSTLSPFDIAQHERARELVRWCDQRKTIQFMQRVWCGKVMFEKANHHTRSAKNNSFPHGCLVVSFGLPRMGDSPTQQTNPWQL